jgi:hypothetical protein
MEAPGLGHSTFEENPLSNGRSNRVHLPWAESIPAAVRRVMKATKVVRLSCTDITMFMSLVLR